MGFYRKKPVVVEAWPTGHMGGGYGRDTSAIKERIVSEGGKAAYRWEGGNLRLTITTLEGKMDVSPGDWVIRGVNGEFYPCKPDIFEQTYDPANPPPFVRDGGNDAT